MSTIYNKTVKKLYKGKYVDIRSYERDQIIEEKKTLVIKLEGTRDRMTMTHHQVKGKFVAKSKLIEWPEGRDYYLYSYNWKPDNKE